MHRLSLVCPSDPPLGELETGEEKCGRIKDSVLSVRLKRRMPGLASCSSPSTSMPKEDGPSMGSSISIVSAHDREDDSFGVKLIRSVHAL